MGRNNMRAITAAIVIGFLSATPAAAQQPLPQIAPERTWPELKEAVQERVNRQGYPLTGFDAGEVRQILDRINSRDPEEWARSWSAAGETHFAAAEAAKGGDPAKARKEYLESWKYFGFGAWPAQTSPGKKASHLRGLEAFRGYIKLADPPIEIIRIPFEGKEIVAYLQLPKDAIKPAPLVISVGGLDSYKEYVVDQYGPIYMKAGLAYLAIDMPGTSEAPLLIDVGAERMFSRLLDHLRTRADIDANRVVIQGVSFGGHWSARVAYTEANRLKGAVVWAGPTDGYFQRDWQAKALGTREYLFDLFAARASVYGMKTLSEYLDYVPRMSLRTAGLLDKPTPAMLLVNGSKDSQVPIEDLYILMKSGSPKEAWVNPEGGHVGRNREWSDNRIFAEVIVPWISRTLR
jgi:pimeloyl-ACP methyl ester carboxylesterase